MYRYSKALDKIGEVTKMQMEEMRGLTEKVDGAHKMVEVVGKVCGPTMLLGITALR